MGRSTVRLLFLALVPLLVGQYVFTLRVEEPYPAILMPGFAQIPETGGEVQTDEDRLRIVFRDGSEREVSRDEFLAWAPASHRPSILHRNFLPGFDLRSGDETLRDRWVRKRCVELTGREDLDSLVVERVRLTRKSRSEPRPQYEQLLDHVVIRF